MTNPKLPLSKEERTLLRQKSVKISHIKNLDVDDLKSVLNVDSIRAKTLIGMAQFQTIPSIGPRLAEDLVLIGKYSLEEMQNEDGGHLIDILEKKRGYWIDPCVEDQLRLVVHYANHPNSRKQWWDLTKERKMYRGKYGYPENRPNLSWEEATFVRDNRQATDV